MLFVRFSLSLLNLPLSLGVRLTHRSSPSSQERLLSLPVRPSLRRLRAHSCIGQDATDSRGGADEQCYLVEGEWEVDCY